ncbi:MAG: hypothetical protein ABW046_23050 [Actinoplanes sp.]
MITASAVLALGPAGCGSAGDSQAEAASAPAGGTAAAAPGDADTPDPIAVEAYLSGLRKIDPELALNQDRAVRRAQETCSDIAGGKFTGPQLNTRAAERLSNGSATIDAKQAAAAIKLMQKHIC